MPNTKSNIEIVTVETETVKNIVLVIKEQPSGGGGINETTEENIIFDASIIYEF